MKDKSIEQLAMDCEDYIRQMGYKKFVISHFVDLIINEIGITKNQIYKSFNLLKQQGRIERKFESTSCKTLCASCYEYGCDKDYTPPISYWTFTLPTTSEIPNGSQK